MQNILIKDKLTILWTDTGFGNLILTINVVDCFKRPSSKSRHDWKRSTKTHNLVRMKEEQVVEDESRSIKSDRGPLIDKCFKLPKNLKIYPCTPCRYSLSSIRWGFFPYTRIRSVICCWKIRRDGDWSNYKKELDIVLCIGYF